MSIQTPDWVKHAVFYQIFPDRFAKSKKKKSLKGTQFKEWGSPPEEQGFQGGNLWGIIDKLDYLQDLGITALYLNPIFSSAANHRYHPYDFFQVDPLLGGNKALKTLLKKAHKRGIKVVLDGVFNHASRGFWAFHHILENGADSPYIDWFTVHDFPLRPYQNSKSKPHNYDSWWNLPALPKFNFKNQGVKKYFLKVAKHWVDFGIDGWRLDVPAEIEDEHFWQEFRRIVKNANPEAYICGEIWDIAPEWLQGDRFDALMNYQFGTAAMSFLGGENLRKYKKGATYNLTPITAEAFDKRIKTVYGAYDWEVNFAQLNLYNSHDTPRLSWLLNEDRMAQKLCVLFQMTMPGAPCIYYGDEIGLTGADDPHCRSAFPWRSQNDWDNDLLAFYKKCIKMRNKHKVLRTGEFIPLFAKELQYAYARQNKNDIMIFIFNINIAEISINLDLSAIPFADEFYNYEKPAQIYPVKKNQLKNLQISAKSVLILRRKLKKKGTG